MKRTTLAAIVLAALILAVLALATAASPAEASWYFKNYCAWDISAKCANRRAEHTKAGKQFPRATTCFGRSC
jgi:hypothetical protein